MLSGEVKVDDQFPDGLRVLIVDDNVDYLKLLYECKYKITTTAEANQALELLRKNTDDYDILITEAKILDMDGFELAKIVRHEIGIPVIMISESDDKEMVIKGVRNGVCDYLVKPIRITELKNIWQHVYRKRLFDAPRVKSHETTIRKREREDENIEICTPKKFRLSWTKALQEKFNHIVNKLGSDAVPNKILELMNEPDLSRAHVASHLQKYRSELKKEKLSYAERTKRKQVQFPSTSNNSQYLIPTVDPQNQFIQEEQLHFGMAPTRNITMTCPTSANLQEQLGASTPILTKNPFMWNSFNNTNVESFPTMNSEYAEFGRGPIINNHLHGLQSYPTFMNLFDYADPTSSLMTVPLSNSNQNEGNGTNIDTLYTGFETSTLQNPLHIESGALATIDENEWIQNAHMMYQQPEMDRKINDEFDSDTLPTI